jgi:hypothetical protein
VKSYAETEMRILEVQGSALSRRKLIQVHRVAETKRRASDFVDMRKVDC